MKAASLIHQAGTFKFKKVKLDELVRKKLDNFWKLFAYAANQARAPLEFEIAFKDHLQTLLPDTDFNDFSFKNALQVTNVWLQAMEKILG